MWLLSTKPIRTIKRADLMDHKHRLDVNEYERYYGVKLHKDLKTHYHVWSFPNMLLSRRSRQIRRGWVIRIHCRFALNAVFKHTKNPPKYAIANSFAIGEFPKNIKKRNAASNREKSERLMLKIYQMKWGLCWRQPDHMAILCLHCWCSLKKIKSTLLSTK